MPRHCRCNLQLLPAVAARARASPRAAALRLRCRPEHHAICLVGASAGRSHVHAARLPYSDKISPASAPSEPSLRHAPLWPSSLATMSSSATSACPFSSWPPPPRARPAGTCASRSTTRICIPSMTRLSRSLTAAAASDLHTRIQVQHTSDTSDDNGVHGTEV
eukprot:365134-Chlamydomonas_euryale.AAC.4